MKMNVNEIKEWLNRGTKVQVLIRKIMVIGIITLMIYGSSYVNRKIIAHLVF